MNMMVLCNLHNIGAGRRLGHVGGILWRTYE
jgi:hypothetical protein